MPDSQNEKRQSPLKPYLPYLITLGVSLAVALAVYPFLPDRIPLQFGLNGAVTRYGGRESVFGIALLPTVIYWGIRRRYFNK